MFWFKLSSFSDSKGWFTRRTTTDLMTATTACSMTPRWWLILSEYEGSPCYERPRIQEFEVRNSTPKLSGFVLPLWEVLELVLSQQVSANWLQKQQIRSFTAQLFPWEEELECRLFCVSREKKCEPWLSALKCTSLKQICFGKIPIGEMQHDSPLARPPVTIHGIRNLIS